MASTWPGSPATASSTGLAQVAKARVCLDALDAVGLIGRDRSRCGRPGRELTNATEPDGEDGSLLRNDLAVNCDKS